MADNIRPRGTVEVDCSCGWSFWVDALDPSLPDGPFACPSCMTEEEVDAELCAMGLDPEDVARRGFEFVRKVQSERGGNG